MRQHHSWISRLTLAGSLALSGAALATPSAPDQPAPAAVEAPADTNAIPAAATAATGGAAVQAADPAATLDQVRQAFLLRFPGVDPTSVTVTPFAGLFEVRVGRDLLYVDEQVNFLLQGALIDAKTRTDLTAERQEELNRVAFDKLPLDLAVKLVRGSGERQIAVFEDPNCGFCKQLHKTLAQIDDVTVHTFLFPILSDDSATKARNIWCAANPSKAWEEWMLQGKVPAKAECDTPIDTLLALGRDMMVQGTPAIIFADGSRVNGAMPLDALRQKLEQSGGKGS